MKNKLRKIIVDDKEYFWLLNTHYELINSDVKEYRALVELKVFKSGLKKTPLTVLFDMEEDAVIGTKITSDSSDINLHRPAYVRALIEAGIVWGWVPEKEACKIVDGISLLELSGISDVRTKEL